jgi:hypothetical protein
MKMKKTIAAVAAMSLVVSNLATIPVLAADTDDADTTTASTATTTAATEVDYTSAKSTVYNMTTPYNTFTSTISASSSGGSLAVDAGDKGLLVSLPFSGVDGTDSGYNYAGFPNLESLLVDSYNRTASALYDVDEVSVTIVSGSNTATYTISSDTSSENYNRDLEYFCTDLSNSELETVLTNGFYVAFDEFSAPILTIKQAYTAASAVPGSGLSETMKALDKVTINVKVSAKTITDISTKVQSTYANYMNDAVEQLASKLSIKSGNNSSEYNFGIANPASVTSTGTGELKVYTTTSKDSKTYINGVDTSSSDSATTATLATYLKQFKTAARASLSDADAAFTTLYTTVAPLASLGTTSASDYQKNLQSVYDTLYNLVDKKVYTDKPDTDTDEYEAYVTAAIAVYNKNSTDSTANTARTADSDSLWGKYKAAAAVLAQAASTTLKPTDVEALIAFYGNDVYDKNAHSTPNTSTTVGDVIINSDASADVDGALADETSAAYALFGKVNMSAAKADTSKATEVKPASGSALATLLTAETNLSYTPTYFAGKISNGDAAKITPAVKPSASYTAKELYEDLQAAGYIDGYNKLQNEGTGTYANKTLEEYILNSIGAVQLVQNKTTATDTKEGKSVEYGSGYSYYTVGSGNYKTIAEFGSAISAVETAKSALATRESELDKLTTSSTDFTTWYNNNYGTSTTSTVSAYTSKAAEPDNWAVTSQKTIGTKTSLLGVESEQWASIGTSYDWRNSSYYLAEILDTIGDNRGCKVTVHVDPLSLKRSDSTDVATVDSRDAAKLIREAASLKAAFRVNGSATNQFTKVISYNTNDSTFELDWDALTGTKFSDTVLYARALDILATDAFGIDTITVTVPDQAQFTTAASTDTAASDTDSEDEDKTIGAGDSDTPEFEDSERPSDDADTVTDSSSSDDDDFWSDDDGTDDGWSDIDLGNSDAVESVDTSTTTPATDTSVDTNTVPSVDVTPVVVTPTDTVATTTTTPSTGNAAPVIAGVVAMASAAYAAFRKIRK